MSKPFVVTVMLISMLLVSMSAQDAKTVVPNASKAMGAEGLISITYSGSAGHHSLLHHIIPVGAH
jgi:hypothetical protein